ncbi:MAG: hypothetical protein GY729_13535, partial [Desulfobacteraceae bacterium]|nr:hypothetical protein [Desulfobacteraceae bacterium]
NVCVQSTITKTFQYLENHGISKYNAILWMISCAANSIPEIRYRIRHDDVVEHDRVDPAFTLLTKDKILAFCTAVYTHDLTLFFSRVDQGIAQTKSNPTLEDNPGEDNLLYVSCVPWMNYTSVTHPMKMDATACIPRISWGKFTHDGNKVTMPVSLQLHHGLADGYHAGLFFEKLDSLLERPEAIEWPE